MLFLKSNWYISLLGIANLISIFFNLRWTIGRKPEFVLRLLTSTSYIVLLVSTALSCLAIYFLLHVQKDKGMESYLDVPKTSNAIDRRFLRFALVLTIVACTLPEVMGLLGFQY